MPFARLANPADLDTLQAFDQFHEINPEVLRSGNCIVAGFDDTVFGYVILSRFFYGRRFVEFLFVHPDQRRKGLGDALLAFAENQAPEEALWISIALGNFNIQTLLHRRGYQHSGVIHDLAKVPELIYHKPPKPKI
jgi:GNAT superfamily N-acetyltransferase